MIRYEARKQTKNFFKGSIDDNRSKYIIWTVLEKVISSATSELKAIIFFL